MLSMHSWFYQVANVKECLRSRYHDAPKAVYYYAARNLQQRSLMKGIKTLKNYTYADQRGLIYRLMVPPNSLLRNLVLTEAVLTFLRNASLHCHTKYLG